MALTKVETRIAQAESALATLDEAIPGASDSVIARESAILRLIYTFATMSRACQEALAELPGSKAVPLNGTICSARENGWLSDEDAEAALKAGSDRDLAFHAYRPGVGEDIAARLAGHAAVLRRWLDALKERAASDT